MVAHVFLWFLIISFYGFGIPFLSIPISQNGSQYYFSEWIPFLSIPISQNGSQYYFSEWIPFLSIPISQNGSQYYFSEWILFLSRMDSLNDSIPWYVFRMDSTSEQVKSVGNAITTEN